MEKPIPPTIHVVDDDEAVRDSMSILLESYGLDVRVYPSARNFLAAGRTSSGSCLLLDLHMPGMTGLELLETLRERGSQVPVIIITGRSDSQLKERAARAGAFSVLDKPVDDDVLFATLNRALAASAQHAR